MQVVILDPALENSNAGDEVISNAIREIDLPFLRGAERITTHRTLRLSERRLIAGADLVFLGGTNAISSHMERFRQWLVDPDLAFRLRGKLVFLGTGWWQYQGEPCAYTKKLLRFISSRHYTHSVRDNYTAARLRRMGLRAEMTGCPTVWELPSSIRPMRQERAAIVTITDYYQEPSADRAWIDEVKKRYDEVRFVAMGPGDEDYMHSLGIRGIRNYGYGVESLRAAASGADHIGTRLHAGIQTMHFGSASLVLAVDNRAREMREAIGLPVAERSSASDVAEALDTEHSASLRVPHDAIGRWVNQFGQSV